MKGAGSAIPLPALFVSCLSPGYVAGGPQCTLAFLQAVSEIHQGRVTYVGPPFVATSPAPDVALESSVWARPRSLASKSWGLITGRYADRSTPVALTYLRRLRRFSGVIYVNGDVVGRT